ncbi:MAG: ABC transporter ATP-binding protein [Oscillospiraceae bacterium]|nr:ABC transporter ATP-binding protein [Oscillospiraceae bacterium]
MKIVFRYLKPYAVFVFISVLLLFGQVVCELTLPNLMSDIVDVGIIRSGVENITPEIMSLPKEELSEMQHDYIVKKGAEMLGVTLAAAVSSIIVGFIASKVASSVARRLRFDIFSKVNEFSNAEFDKYSTASLITRSTNDVQQIQNLISMGLKMMLFAPLMGTGSIIMALRKSTSLAWIIVVAVLVIMGVLGVVMAAALPKFKSLQTLVDRLNLVSREQLSGLMVIRAFGNEKYEEERFDVANKNLTYTTRFVQRTMVSLMPSVSLIMSLVNVAIVWFGAKAISQSTLEVGDMMAFLQYAIHIMISFLFVSMIFIMLPRATVAANRIKEVLEENISIKDKENAETLENVEGNIEFQNVSFRYNDALEDALSDISFMAEAGKTTAFIGSTGSGKSTLINLIPRFYDVTSGKVLIDGKDIRDVTVKSLREKIGYVSQKAVLFSGTIESNVKYGNDSEDIMDAIKVAQAEDFVLSKEDGINSEVAQGATNVSGGQKQRLSIARALAKKAPIYIFDDSFSALDFKTDAALRAALSKYTNNATVLIVAQRVSTIMNADKIVVLDEGKVVGIGDHKSLLENCMTYREICESQLGEEELA